LNANRRHVIDTHDVPSRASGSPAISCALFLQEGVSFHRSGRTVQNGHAWNTAAQEADHWLVWLKLDPRFDRLRTDPRFVTFSAGSAFRSSEIQIQDGGGE
jgi:hypothetical protein